MSGMAVPNADRPSSTRLIAVTGMVMAIGGLAAGLLFHVLTVGENIPVIPTVDAPVTGAVAGGPAKRIAPSFDLVRVSPQGNVVIAGRGAPGAEVIVREGATEIARASVDRRGEFVALSAVPLREGGRELTLSSREADGPEVKGDGSVVLVVPATATATAINPAGVAPVMAMLVPSAAAPRILGPSAGGAAKGGVLVLDTVDYDDKGSIQFKGGAAAGSAVRVYVDNEVVGDGLADAAGRWSLVPSGTVSPGMHKLRVDQIDRVGRVVRRVELPFQRAVLNATEVAGGQVVVQPGQNLWRMARAAYGRGMQYTVIYLANRDQIRDARLIYPGQAFSVPVQ